VNASIALLIGFKSCGKSTFGPPLATRLGGACADLDRLLERRHAHESGESLPAHEIFRHYGTARFASLEASVLDALHTAPPGSPDRPAVLATTGATPLDAANVTRMRRLGPLVLLDTPREVILRRWLSGRLPAFLDAAAPEASFEHIYREREPLYRAAADIVVSTHERSDEAVIAEIVCRLRDAPQFHGSVD